MVGVFPVVVDIVKRSVTTYFCTCVLFLECMFVFVTFAAITIPLLGLKRKRYNEKNNTLVFLSNHRLYRTLLKLVY